MNDNKDHVIQTAYAVVDEEGKTARAGLDYSGAHEKTDPAEIKLAGKLDTWIMVSIFFNDVFKHH